MMGRVLQPTRMVVADLGPRLSRAPLGGRIAGGAPIGLLLAVLSVLIGLTGCRRPDPVYDRVPRPVGTRDVVRAERRDGTPLTDAERIRLIEVHDRYLESFDELRQSELIPFAADYRELDNEAIYRDERKLRSMVSRHLSIVGRIESLDEDFFTELTTALGPDRRNFVTRLRNRRLIDRASALSAGDGGRTLLDVRQLVDQLELGESERLATEPLLLAFEEQASVIAVEIGREQATLPLSYMSVIERRGSAESAVSSGLRDEARQRARERAEFERYAESRRDLEQLLFRYTDLVDQTIESVAALVGEEDAAFLRRRLLRLRFDDEIGSTGDAASFEALVAARTRRLPVEVRDRIEAMRVAFLAEDEARLRSLVALHRSSREPGVYDPVRAKGGGEAVKRQKEQWAEIEKDRKTAAKRLRDEVFALLPDDLRGEIEGLRGKNRDEFTASLAGLVGSGRVPMLVQRKPRGFADRDPPRQDNGPRRDGDPGELRMMLAAAPDDVAIELLETRSGVDAPSAMVVREIVAGWRERWEATRDPARTKVQQLMAPIMGAMNGGDPKVFDQAAARLISGFEELRREREQLDADLLASIEAALPAGLDPAARELWVRERSEASRRLRWRDLPFGDTMRMPPEAIVPFIDTINRAPIGAEHASAIVGAIAPFAGQLDSVTERLRQEALVTVRKAMALVIEGRTKGMGEEQSLSESRPEVKRALAPLRSVALELATLRMDVLMAVVAALPEAEGRVIREQFVRVCYPRLLDERRMAERALAGVGDDPSLSEIQRAAWEAVMVARSITRDRALDRILDWSREWRATNRPLGDDVNGRDVAGRKHPQLAGVFFARDEADARAVRAASGLLSAEQRERHGDLADYFNEPPVAARWLD